MTSEQLVDHMDPFGAWSQGKHHVSPGPTFPTLVEEFKHLFSSLGLLSMWASILAQLSFNISPSLLGSDLNKWPAVLLGKGWKIGTVNNAVLFQGPDPRGFRSFSIKWF